MKKTTSIFTILLVAISFFALSFTKDQSKAGLLGASKVIATNVENAEDLEEGLPIKTAYSRPGMVVTYTVKCGISLYMSQELMICFVVAGTVDHLTAGLNNEKTPARLMGRL